MCGVGLCLNVQRKKALKEKILRNVNMKCEQELQMWKSVGLRHIIEIN